MEETKRITCRECGRTEDLLFIKRFKSNGFSRGYLYRQRDGLWWNGQRCNDCEKSRQREWGYSTGRFSPLDESNGFCTKKGRTSERFVLNRLLSLGLDAKINPRPNGVDIHIQLPIGRVSAEVKPVLPNNAGKNWRTPGVSFHRRSDDVILALWPDGNISMHEMAQIRTKTKCLSWPSIESRGDVF